MTSEEGDENPSSTGPVLNGNPPMTHVSTDVLKEFMTHTLDRSKSPVSFPNSNLSNSEKKMQLIECESNSIENPIKKIRLDSCSEEKVNANSVSTLPMSPKVADTKPTSVLSATPEKANGNSTLPTPPENGSNTSIVPYSNTLLLAMSSSSISLTPKLQGEQTKKSFVPVEKSKENMESEESLPFTSSVSLTMKVPSSPSATNKTSPLTEKAFSLPKSPKNVTPPESLSDLEKKIVGSVSISQKNVNKQLDEMENIDELLNPGSPFSDTSSHISLSLEESLLRDDLEVGNEENESSTNQEKSSKNDKVKVGEECEENGEKLLEEQSNDEKTLDKERINEQKDLVNSTSAKSLLYEEINGEEPNSIKSKDETVVALNNLVAQSDKDEVKTTTQDKSDNISDNARDIKGEKKNDVKVNDYMDKTPEGNDLIKENTEVATLDLAKDNIKKGENTEKIPECKNEKKQNLDEDKSDKDINESKKIENETVLSDVKSDIVDDIFEADEASVEDGNETNFAIFDEKDDYNDDSDEETIKPAISLLIGSLAKDIRGEGSDNSCSSKHSSTDQDEESSVKAIHINENAINVKEDECKSDSSSKEISTSLQMDVNEGSQSSATMSTSNQIEEDDLKKKSQQSKSSLSSADISAKETLQSSINLKETDLDKKGDTKKSSSLTFTEALKSIEADSGDMFQSLKSKLEPLKPSAEFVSNESLPSEKTLTVLQPALKRPIGDISTGRDGTSSLKKMRFFKNDKDPLATQDSDTVKDDHSSLLLGMDKCLQKEKKIFGATDKRSMNDVDPEELRRRTAIELEKVKPPKSLAKLHRITRKELETLVVELFMDKVLYEHELGQQRDLCRRLEATLETNRKKAAQFHKEVEDLKKVTQRLQAEHQARKGQVVAPVKVKRSVGIQATPSIIGKGLMHASSGNNTIRLLSPSKSASRSPTPTKYSSAETKQSTTASGNKSSKPAGPKRQTNKTTTTAVQTNSIAVSGAGGKVRQIQTTRVVVSQPVNAPSSQVNTNTNSMVMVNPSQKIITTTGPVSALIPTTMNTCFVRAAPAQIPAISPAAQGIISNSSPSLPVASIVQRVSIANSGGAGLIDLTDDDDNKGASPQQARIATSTVLVPRSTASTTSQFVIPHQSQMGQLLLVPSSNGAPTTLVVGNMPGATQTAIMNGSPNTILRPNILSANPQRFAPGTRVMVGAQMNGGTMIQTIARPKHPAPLPEAPSQEMGLVGYSKKLPPVPILKLSHKDNSIVLSWNMNKTDEHDVISSYQLFAYQEGTAPPSPLLWKKVGSVKALELPMACTLTQFMPGHVYHFAVRAVDAKCRSGPFSEPKSIRLQKQ